MKDIETEVAKINQQPIDAEFKSNSPKKIYNYMKPIGNSYQKKLAARNSLSPTKYSKLSQSLVNTRKNDEGLMPGISEMPMSVHSSSATSLHQQADRNLIENTHELGVNKYKSMINDY